MIVDPAALRWLCCAVINATIEFVAYRPLRHAPRLAPLITAIGMSFILADVALIWKGAELRARSRACCRRRTVCHDRRRRGLLDDADRRLLVTMPGAARPPLPRPADEAGQGDARDRPGHGRERDHGHQRQPDDLVHVPDRRRRSPAPPASSTRSRRPTVRFDQGFTLGLIAFTAAVLGGIGNLPGAVLGALLIGLIQAFNEGAQLARAGLGLDRVDRLHDPDPDPRLPPRGPARRTDARGGLAGERGRPARLPQPDAGAVARALGARAARGDDRDPVPRRRSSAGRSTTRSATASRSSSPSSGCASCRRFPGGCSSRRSLVAIFAIGWLAGVDPGLDPARLPRRVRADLDPGAPAALGAAARRRADRGRLSVLRRPPVHDPVLRRLPRCRSGTGTYMMVFMMMAVGLNIVVGYAGLLDLGYVAFYAIGAYTAGWFASAQFAGQKCTNPHFGSRTARSARPELGTSTSAASACRRHRRHPPLDLPRAADRRGHHRRSSAS